jgi:hypothetical protein
MSAIITQAETFSLLQRWLEDGTFLRFWGNLPALQFSFDANLTRVAEPFLAFGSASGSIGLMFDETWTFSFGAPDAMGVPMDERIGESSNRMENYEYGECIWALHPHGGRLCLIEIVGEDRR